jgi:hypothetical protein
LFGKVRWALGVLHRARVRARVRWGKAESERRYAPATEEGVCIGAVKGGGVSAVCI